MIRLIKLGLMAFPISFALGFASLVGYNFVFHTQEVFAEAAWWNLTYMKIAYALGADVNTPGCRYRLCPPPIVAAVYGDHLEGAQFLIERGANVNAQMSRTTALMAAVIHDNVEMVKLLIANGADVNVDTYEEEEHEFLDDTALKLAKRRGHTEIIELLKQAGAVDAP